MVLRLRLRGADATPYSPSGWPPACSVSGRPLLLSAGVTVLAVTEGQPAGFRPGCQHSSLTSVALASALPPGRHRRALAILGCLLLAIDLYVAGALGLIPATAVNGLIHAELSYGLVAAINLLMSGSQSGELRFRERLLAQAAITSRQ